MYYQGGFPKFNVEKPIVIPWRSKQLLTMESSGDYVADIKLNEHRSLLTTNKAGEFEFFNRQGRKVVLPDYLLPELKKLKLPPCSILDGGHLQKKATFPEMRVWLFDVLIWKGEKTELSFKERRKLLDQVVPQNQPHIWKPLQTGKFIHEFMRLLDKKSELIAAAAKEYGVPVELLFPEIEGFVVKNLNGKNSYPGNVKESPSFFKLRTSDVLPKNRKWLVAEERT